MRFISILPFTISAYDSLLLAGITSFLAGVTSFESHLLVNHVSLLSLNAIFSTEIIQRKILNATIVEKWATTNQSTDQVQLPIITSKERMQHQIQIHNPIPTQVPTPIRILLLIIVRNLVTLCQLLRQISH